MSAEHKLFLNGPDWAATNIGVTVLDEQPISVYSEPYELPCDPERRAICAKHIASGLKDQMISDFWMQGCDFDKSLEEGIVRVQFSCPGVSRVLKHCRLTLTQYDREGNKLNTGKFRQKIE